MKQQVITNKGTFKVRYAFNDKGQHTIVVMVYGDKGPFEGKYGDQIPVTKEMERKYKVKYETEH